MPQPRVLALCGTDDDAIPFERRPVELARADVVRAAAVEARIERAAPTPPSRSRVLRSASRTSSLPCTVTTSKTSVPGAAQVDRRRCRDRATRRRCARSRRGRSRASRRDGRGASRRAAHAGSRSSRGAARPGAMRAGERRTSTSLDVTTSTSASTTDGIELRARRCRAARAPPPRAGGSGQYGRSESIASKASHAATTRAASGIVLAGEAVRIPEAVPPLVGRADDRADGLERRHRAQQALADDRVRPHQPPLLLVERPRLPEHEVGDRDLADVVQLRREHDHVDLVDRHPERKTDAA